MPKKSKLLSALDAHKGRDYRLEKQKKQMKEAEKRKRIKQKKQVAQEGSEAGLNGVAEESKSDSEGWESDESEAPMVRALSYHIESKQGLMV